jgi:NAD(P)-dependent dehydrogenase (short-subunit alcohol dehydrogenase family)
MLAIQGFSSSLAQALLEFLPPWETALSIERAGTNVSAQRYLFAQGMISPKRIGEMTPKEQQETWHANAGMTIEKCNMILALNDEARICIIGSESGFAWSYDDCYAAAKAAVHRYVETKKLKPNQQLICIAPSIIEDSRMTRSRKDADNLLRRAAENPKQRFLRMSEVCRLIHYVLYTDDGYLTNTVIRMNGGAHTK